MSKIIGKRAWEAQDIAKHRPHGDRLLVEKVEIEDAVYVDTGEGEPVKLLIQRANKRDNPRNPSPQYTNDELQELARGWILVQVVAIGDGHRLEMDMKVPMPFYEGEYLYVERLAQHSLEFRGEKYYIISQVDVLLHADSLNKAPKLEAVK